MSNLYLSENAKLYFLIGVVMVLTLIFLLVLLLVPWSTSESSSLVSNSKHSANASFVPHAAVFPNSPLVVSVPNALRFGEFMFVHDQGFVAISSTNALLFTKMFLYQVTDQAVNKLPTELLLPSFLQGQIGQLPVQAELCGGAFLPSLGILDEVLYLVLVLGVSDADQNKFGRELHFYYYDTDTLHPNSQVWTKSTLIIQHPYFGTDLNPRPSNTPPYVGCFGNRIQGLVDLNIIGGTRQSLYVSGTEFSNLRTVKPQPSPGGMVFEYLFLTNTIAPVLALQYTVQDAKLRVISEDPDTPQPSPLQTDLDYYMRGFGSVFYATPGFLAVSNLTNQDDVDYPCDAVGNLASFNGYVQVFESVNGVWTQENTICTTESNGSLIYVNRITAPSGALGFGASLLLTSNFLFVSTSNNLTFVYNLGTNHLPSPPDPNARVWSEVKTTDLASTTTFPGPVFNRTLLLLNGNLVIGSYSVADHVNTIGIFQTSSSTTSPSVVTPSTANNLFTNFTLLQTIGSDINSGSALQSLIGFGQWIQTCTSPNRLRQFLFVNNPLGNNVYAFET